MEEVVQDVDRRGSAGCASVGRSVTAPQRATDRSAYPTTVQGVLAARIDRLTPDEKALLQQLAVIGREFPLSLIAGHCPARRRTLSPARLPPAQRISLRTARVSRGRIHLQACADAGSGLQHGAPGATQSLARAHGAGDRSSSTTTIDEHYSELAHHYSRSGNTEKAVSISTWPGNRRCSARPMPKRSPPDHRPRAAQDPAGHA